MKLYVTDDESVIVSLIRTSWTPVHPEGVHAIQLGLGSIFDSPPVTHLYLDRSIRKLKSSAGLPTLVNLCQAGALVGVVEIDGEKAGMLHERASSEWGIDLSGHLSRTGRWSPALERHAQTQNSVRELLELSGVQDVRTVSIADEILNTEFPVSRSVAWQYAMMGIVKGIE
jgi:hypothetical protein